ncbi:MAG: pyrrolysine--tRNA(Pyl) ligase large subunit [Firmicutes bacterium HGW-Firmicutes-14]|jgi:phenylalanyl-tRNA synthetase alpha chain|nr:MAG: pyrrolysine--tRNA(Pyl) ligase large subunit [Firmicutes bacterium HGW-Firmicutes-14]
MKLAFTVTQQQRLIELDASGDIDGLVFNNEQERDLSFRELNRELVQKNKQRLHRLREETMRPAVRELESLLIQALNKAGFVEVATPTTMSAGMLGKMGITRKHPLWEQVYWLGKNTCLRPMLAPNLYYLLGRLSKTWPSPVRIFEVGQCFRKESKGARHLSEFTMLNMVEMGNSADSQKRLEEMADLVMKTAGIDYRFEGENSEVYGNTTDVMVDDVEIASGATGPHPLDVNWDIADSWAGVGFGLERLIMAKEGFNNIRRVGRSLIYLDGARLNV